MMLVDSNDKRVGSKTHCLGTDRQTGNTAGSHAPTFMPLGDLVSNKSPRSGFGIEGISPIEGFKACYTTGTSPRHWAVEARRVAVWGIPSAKLL